MQEKSKKNFVAGRLAQINRVTSLIVSVGARFRGLTPSLFYTSLGSLFASAEGMTCRECAVLASDPEPSVFGRRFSMRLPFGRGGLPVTRLARRKPPLLPPAAGAIVEGRGLAAAMKVATMLTISTQRVNSLEKMCRTTRVKPWVLVAPNGSPRRGETRAGSSEAGEGLSRPFRT